MVPQEIFEPAGKDVVSEEIDGEVVIVNLNNGNYYSLTQSAAVSWSGSARGAPAEPLRTSGCARSCSRPSRICSQPWKSKG